MMAGQMRWLFLKQLEPELVHGRKAISTYEVAMGVSASAGPKGIPPNCKLHNHKMINTYN